MKRLAVVYLAHDGFASLYSGVGIVARDFMLSFPEVARSLRKKHPGVKLQLFVATMKYNEKSFALSPAIRNKTIEFTAKHRIKFVELNNGSAAQDAYGKFENWQFASISAATFLHMISGDFDRVLAICVDTPFVQVANRFIDTYDEQNVEFIWLPQSTVKIHGYGMSSDASQQGDVYVNQRYQWEKGVVELANQNPRVRIGCVGEFMKRHLMSEYSAEPDVLVDITNSLYLPRLRGYKRSQKEIARFLQEAGIPTNRPLLFFCWQSRGL
jgi:hypothetical protein